MHTEQQSLVSTAPISPSARDDQGILDAFLGARVRADDAVGGDVRVHCQVGERLGGHPRGAVERTDGSLRMAITRTGAVNHAGEVSLPSFTDVHLNLRILDSTGVGIRVVWRWCADIHIHTRKGSGRPGENK